MEEHPALDYYNDLKQVAREWEDLRAAILERLDKEEQYRLLVNSFMYAGGDNFQVIREADPQGFDTGIHYRQPFVDYLARLATSRANPLTLDLLAGASQP